MQSENLWGDLSDLALVRTPKSLLKEQGDYLTKATNGLLIGVVHEESTVDNFWYDLNVKVPTLNNYVYTILSLRHGIELYPTNVMSRSLPEAEQCNDEEELKQIISKVLSSNDVRYVLSRLKSQVV